MVITKIEIASKEAFNSLTGYAHYYLIATFDDGHYETLEMHTDEAHDNLLVTDIQHPTNPYERELFAAVATLFASGDLDAQWALINGYAEEISNRWHYELTDANSTTFMASVLSMMGVNLKDVEPEDDLSDLGADCLVGGSHANHLRGFDDDDFIRGGGGNDTLDGGNGAAAVSGNDTLWGDEGETVPSTPGNDALYGRDGDDELIGGAGDDVLDCGEDNDIAVGDSLEVPATTGSDTLYGGAGHDWMTGGPGDDSLDGGADNDTLYGDSDQPGEIIGKDVFAGGAGNDNFIVGGDDRILDPDMGDRIGFLGEVSSEPIWLHGGKAPECDSEDTGDAREEYNRPPGGYFEETDGGTVGYDWSEKDSKLIIHLPDGSTVTVEDWENGANGGTGEAHIKLTEPDDDCKSDDAKELGSPLILDLDGDGLELIDASESWTYFDIDQDGFAERTGWVSPDDGLLALDANANGEIDDVSELFGAGGFADRWEIQDEIEAGHLPSGFDELRALDENEDGVIDSKDSAFADLKVWRDLNGDGISQGGELQSLASLGIASLNLTTTQDFVEQGENILTDFGSYTRVDNTTADIVDVWFGFDAQRTQYRGEVDIDPATDGLPKLLGYGETKDLVVSMSEDPQLLAMVSDFKDLTAADASTLEDRAEAILLRWYGADAADPQSRGDNIDARWLTALEGMYGEPWHASGGMVANPNANAGALLTEAWRDYKSCMMVRLLAQTPLGQVLFPGLAYNAMAFITLPNNVSLTDTIDNLVAHSPTDGTAKLQYWQSMILVLDALYPELKETFTEEYEGQFEEQFVAAIEDGLSTDGVAYSYEELRSANMGGDGDDLLMGVGSTFDTPFTPLLVGGEGNDTYVVGSKSWGSGLDVVFEGAAAGTDTVLSWESFVLPANVENLTLLGTAAINATGNDLDNVITGNTGTNTLTGGLGDDTYIVQNTTDVIVELADEGVDSVQSSATYTLSANVESLTLTGSANINGTGNAAANVIDGNSGDNVLDGGSGADTLAGGLSNDSYVVDASDTIVENADEGTDTIRAAASFDLGTVANVENLTLLGSGAIDGTGSAVANLLTGNTGANQLQGLAGDDTLSGGSGNDTLTGGDGADSIDLGSGNDRVTYLDVLDAGDTVTGFGTGGAGQDYIDLDALFDALNGGIASANRAGRVQLVDTGPDVELRIDTAAGTGAGDGVGDVTLMTFSGLSSTSALTIGTAANSDIQIGAA
jgi:Ca2+-binding RTX toxin-like protein